MYARMFYLFMRCLEFAAAHQGQFPKDMDQLAAVVARKDVLRKVLGDGAEAEILYLPPRKDGCDWAKEIVLYEAYHAWPKQGIAVCFRNGSCGVIDNPVQFEQLMREPSSQPARVGANDEGQIKRPVSVSSARVARCHHALLREHANLHAWPSATGMSSCVRGC